MTHVPNSNWVKKMALDWDLFMVMARVCSCQVNLVSNFSMESLGARSPDKIKRMSSINPI